MIVAASLATSALPLEMQFAQFAIIAFGVSCTAVGLFFTWREIHVRNRLARRQRLLQRNIREITMDQTVRDRIQYFRTVLNVADQAEETAPTESNRMEGSDENSEEEEGEDQ